jgi:hypothetical protein
MTYAIKIECSICKGNLGYKEGGNEPDMVSHSMCESCAINHMKEQMKIMEKTRIVGPDALIILKDRLTDLTNYIYGPKRTTVEGIVEILEQESIGMYLFQLKQVVGDLYGLDSPLVKEALDDVLTIRRRRAIYA